MKSDKGAMKRQKRQSLIHSSIVASVFKITNDGRHLPVAHSDAAGGNGLFLDIPARPESSPQSAGTIRRRPLSPPSVRRGRRPPLEEGATLTVDQRV